MPDGRPLRTAALALTAACLVACTGSTTGGSASAAAPGRSAVASPSAPNPVTVPKDVLDPLVADAASRASVDASAVTIVDATAQTWPNGALGCPSPGVMYTQAIVNGWRVVLAAGNEQLDYRTSGPGRFKLCTSAPGGGSPAGSGAPG